MVRAYPARRDERGAAAVELALVAPLLLLLLCGIVSYGYLLTFRQGVGRAAADGVRAAVVSASGDQTDDEIEDEARAGVTESLHGWDLTCTSSGLLQEGTTTVGTCVVDVRSCADGSGATCVFVTVDHEYRDHPMLPLPGVGLVLPQHLSYSASGQVDA